MFELAGVPRNREALRLAMHKLPCKCKIVSREDLEGGDNSEINTFVKDLKAKSVAELNEEFSR